MQPSSRTAGQKTRWPNKHNHRLEARPWGSITPPIDVSCSYPIRALSSPCFLFFRLLTDTSSWLRVNGGQIICSSSRTWVYMSRKISCSRKHKGWSRLELPKLVLCSTLSLPCCRVSLSTQCIFHIITRPIRLLCKKPLFSLSERIPARPFGLKLAL